MEQLNKDMAIQLGKALEAERNLTAILNKIVPHGVKYGIFEVKDNDISLIEPKDGNDEKSGKKNA